MTDDHETHVKLHMQALVAIRTGAIPDQMYTYMSDPRMPVFAEKPDYFIEVKFDE